VIAIAAALLALTAPLAPEELGTIGGGAFSLDAALARAPVVMVFWSSWLPDASASVSVIRDIERTTREHGWPGAIVVFQDEPAAAAAILGSEGAGLPRVLDPRGVLLRRFQVTRAPALLVVDRDGQVISRSRLDAAEVHAALQSLAARTPDRR
jgi:hypothetical protein